MAEAKYYLLTDHAVRITVTCECFLAPNSLTSDSAVISHGLQKTPATNKHMDTDPDLRASE